ncbi:MAG: feruloyl-CoA synthase [Pseudomonadota bacterium]
MTSFFDDPRMLAPRQTVRENLPGGAFVLRNPEPLGPYPRAAGAWLEHWAATTPDAPAFAEPAPGDTTGGAWVTLSWAALRRRTGAVAQALLDLDLRPDAPVVVLSDNALDHLVLKLACMHVGRPVCTVSSGYTRLAGGDYTRLLGILQQLGPALLYAADAGVYAAAMTQATSTPAARGAPLVFSRGAADVPGALAFDALAGAAETPAVMRAFERVGPDTHAKYLLTSGSTGHPKVVINTQRMLCANQQMMAQTMRWTQHEPTVLLDWLPWSHTFGGNHNVNMILRTGGTMYIDDGRPLPGLIERTVAHLRHVQPTIQFNVPRAYEMLLPALESDAELARRYFDKMRMVFYAGAGMPVAIWKRLEAVAAKVRDEPVWFTTSWGSTETAPAVTFANWQLDRPGVIGLPMPGAELKFVPNGDKLELRVRGPNVFPGYRGDEAATRAAFDEDGYYRIGDAGRLLDPADDLSGVVFDGRVAEDFKLGSGTWVSVGTLRLAVVTALAPLAQDVVVTGHDRAGIGVLVFVGEAGRRHPPDELRGLVRARLQALHDEAGGSSKAPGRALLLPDAPSLATGEITDKGYVNQRLVLARRAAEVERLHAAPRGTAEPDVVVL